MTNTDAISNAIAALIKEHGLNAVLTGITVHCDNEADMADLNRTGDVCDAWNSVAELIERAAIRARRRGIG